MSDLISRADAIKTIKKRMGNKPLPPTEIYTYFECIDAINELPSSSSAEVECYVNGQMVVRGVPDGYLRDDIEGVIVYSDSFYKRFEVVR